MSEATTVYREISNRNPSLINWLDLRNQLYNVKNEKDGSEHLFIDNDVPRDRSITPLIVEETVGFALFDNEGELIATYKSLLDAVNAQKTARVVVNVDVSVDDDGEA